jgi:hypothetical protein
MNDQAALRIASTVPEQDAPQNQKVILVRTVAFPENVNAVDAWPLRMSRRHRVCFPKIMELRGREGAADLRRRHVRESGAKGRVTHRARHRVRASQKKPRGRGAFFARNAMAISAPSAAE